MQLRSNSTKPDTREKNSLSASSVFTTVEDTLVDVSRNFHNFVDDVESLVKEASSLTGDELEQAREKLNQRIATARDLVEEKGDSLAKQARKSVTAGNKYVHQQPWQIVGASAALGLLIGLVLVRRK